MRIVTDVGVPVVMRDGTTLLADVHRPDGPGPVPVLLMRTPYDRSMALGNHFYDGFRFVREGYAVVVQDVRGRYGSEGEFYPFRNEAADGVDMIAWAARQPWSTGRVGMIGASYVGTTQWLPAAEHPPALRAIAPIVTVADYRDGWVYRGDAFELGFCLQWTLSLCVDAADRLVAAGSQPQELVERARDAQDRIESLYGGLDAETEDLIRMLAPWYDDWRRHPQRDAGWASIAPDLSPASAVAPALDIGGWHDIFVVGTLDGFRLQRQAAIAAGRPGPRLVIGPWSHGIYTGMYPGRRYGVRSAMDVMGVADEQVRWFDRWLRDRPNGVEEMPPVRVFIMGVDRWRDFDDWPPQSVVPWTLHLRAGARLSPEPPPADEDPDDLVFDPHRPVPTLGGGTLLMASTLGERVGPSDVAALANREDVLAYQSGPLGEARTIIGPVRLTVHATATAQSFDLAAQLADVGPDGRWELLVSGIQRVRDGDSATERIVELGSTAATIPPGHRIGLLLAASDFPRFDLNPAATAAGGTTIAVEHATLRPSRLVLSMLPD
ncbi:MAG TPA: CocE/NonD family hydrolase [Candidatus Limnocylindrales bacterium]|nr:CocE/NonD family hydrolase [Candidatus Limnocylindrales bacterium]